MGQAARAAEACGKRGSFPRARKEHTRAVAGGRSTQRHRADGPLRHFWCASLLVVGRRSRSLLACEAGLALFESAQAALHVRCEALSAPRLSPPTESPAPPGQLALLDPRAGCRPLLLSTRHPLSQK